MRAFVITGLLILTFFTSGCVYMLLPEKMQLVTTGRYSEAEQYMSGRIGDGSSAETPDLVYLCYAYSKLKKYDRLFSCLDRMEDNFRRGDRRGYRSLYDSVALFPSDLTSLPHLLRAEAYIDLGNYPAAIVSAGKAYGIVKTTRWSPNDNLIKSPLYYRIFALRLLALSHALNGDREEAKRYAGELAGVNVGFGGASLFVKERELGLARVYMALGDYEKILANRERFMDAFTSFAEVLIGSALAGQSMFAFVELPKQFMIQHALYETGRHEEAKSGFDRLLANPNIRYNGDIYWPILYDRGRIAEKERSGEGVRFFEKAIDIIEVQRSTINTEASKIGFVGDKQQVYHSLISALLDKQLAERAFEYVERSKSRALVDLLAAREDVTQAAGPRAGALLKEMGAIEREARVLDENSLRAENVAGRRTRSVAVRQKLTADFPELASLVTVSAIPAGEFRSLLQDDETLLEYYYAGNDLYAFVLTRRELKALKLEGSGLAEEIEAFRKSVQDAGSKHFVGLSRKLYGRLFGPLENLINTQRILLVPHGPLHYLPFNALNDGRQDLIDRYSIGFLPSASIIKFMERKAPAGRGLLVFGNPDIGDRRYDLKYAEEEAMVLSRLHSQASVFLRDRATKEAFLREAGQFGYIHLATHGIFRGDAPLHSGIFLAKGSRDSGFLNVNELYGLRLNAELVTLSACETGLGKIGNGDDAVGFTRGFLYAGARAIVSSLWKVDDQATSRLMAEFYANLKKDHVRDALRKAQLSVRKQYDHPFFWAAFQLTGTGR
jgi:CHAT domain-containing protein